MTDHRSFASIAPIERDDLKVVPDTVRNQAYEKLRRAIVTGYFLPGQRLVERELCEMIGVSRTSIREAARTLEAEKLIVIVPYRGPCVATLTAEEATQIYEVRRVLEGLAAQRAAELATDLEIEMMDRIVRSFDKAVAARNLHALVDLAGQFYDTLLRASRNDVARDLLSSINARISLLRATSMADPKRTAHSAAEMRSILEAVRAHDPAAAVLACTIHVRNAAAAAREHLLKSGPENRKATRSAKRPRRASN